jgi:hypothetical protein
MHRAPRTNARAVLPFLPLLRRIAVDENAGEFLLKKTYKPAGVGVGDGLMARPI